MLLKLPLRSTANTAVPFTCSVFCVRSYVIPGQSCFVDMGSWQIFLIPFNLNYCSSIFIMSQTLRSRVMIYRTYIKRETFCSLYVQFKIRYKIRIYCVKIKIHPQKSRKPATKRVSCNFLKVLGQNNLYQTQRTRKFMNKFMINDYKSSPRSNSITLRVIQELKVSAHYQPQKRLNHSLEIKSKNKA